MPPPHATEHALQSDVTHEYVSTVPHVRDPPLLVQVTPVPHPPLFVAHSLMSTHEYPLPVLPSGQGEHWYDPGLLAHWTAGMPPPPAKQPPLFVEHSLMSVQVTPSPLYPDGQALQFREPKVFEHVDCAKHPPLLVAHSLMSVQERVVPSLLSPVGHVAHDRSEVGVHATPPTPLTPVPGPHVGEHDEQLRKRPSLKLTPATHWFPHTRSAVGLHATTCPSPAGHSVEHA
ncbi:MAG: hypothetical protein ABI665_10620 [Vicinamibacterales bacterium]